MPSRRLTPVAMAAVPLALCLLAALLAPLVDAARASSAGIGGIRAAVNAQRAGAAARSTEEEAVAARLAALRSRPSEYSSEAAADLVPYLPGWGAVNDFNLFAGYITVDEDNGRALFYILAEATDSEEPSTAAAAAAHQRIRRSAVAAEDDDDSSGGDSSGGDLSGGPEEAKGAGEEDEAGEGAREAIGSEASGGKPLVAWFNGGPGCSSIGGGFMTELGPFFPLPGGRDLQRNPHAWNEFAHVLFVESPAFVGFSYSNTTADAIVGDARTAADARVFMLRFLERFPRFRTAPFYVSGESYAGHYVPNLALAIVEGNKAAATSGDPKINLQGFLVGNPWTDTAIDNMGAIDYWWSHALVSDQTAQGVRANCNFSRIGPLDPHPAHRNAETRDELCDDFCNKAFDELGAINIYEIYADLCDEPPGLRRQVEALNWALTHGSSETTTGGDGDAHGSAPGAVLAAAAAAVGARKAAAAAAIATAAAGGGGRRQRRRLAHQHQQQLQGGGGASYKSTRLSYAGDGSNPEYDPCIDDEAETYLNLPEVQRALHANQTVKLPWRWTDCTRSIMYSREDLLSSMLPTYQRLLQANLRILVFSGDVDGIVPVVGTRRWVASLRLKEKEAWRPWFSGTQVGGYVVEYDGLTFATVRGAGHMVPYVQPVRAFHMIKAFLSGEQF